MAKKKAPKKKKANKKPKQDVLDPRKVAFLEGFSDPKSPTFGNAKGSAIAAGYSEQYADNITVQMPEWLSGFLGEDAAKLAKVERNIHKFLDLPTQEQMVGPNGLVYEDKEKTVPKVVENPRFLQLQLDMTKFVAERLNRAKYGKDDKVNIGFHFSIGPAKAKYRTVPDPKLEAKTT